MSEAVELEPCPFCGGKARTLEYNGTTQATCAVDGIECAGTDVLAPVAMWNRRSLTGEGEPVAWQVKDYADGWITFYSHERARQEAEEMGGLIRPVYAGPAMLAASGGGE